MYQPGSAGYITLCDINTIRFFTMLIRKRSPHRQERDWYFFSTGLMARASSDYMVMRTMFQLEPLTNMSTIVVLMLDVVEKALKLHHSVLTQTAAALSDMKSRYGHNIELLRADCAGFNPLFNDPDICAFTKDLDDRDGKLYQQLRYSSQETTAGFKANPGLMLPVVDKVFIQSVLLLPDNWRRLLLQSSSIYLLLTRSHMDQTRHPEQTINFLALGNAYFLPLQAECQRVAYEHSPFLAEPPAHVS
jgi:hypothetical protein